MTLWISFGRRGSEWEVHIHVPIHPPPPWKSCVRVRGAYCRFPPFITGLTLFLLSLASLFRKFISQVWFYCKMLHCKNVGSVRKYTNKNGLDKDLNKTLRLWASTCLYIKRDWAVYFPSKFHCSNTVSKCTLNLKKERERKKIDKNITGHPWNGIDTSLDKLGLLFTGYL